MEKQSQLEENEVNKCSAFEAVSETQCNKHNRISKSEYEKDEKIKHQELPERAYDPPRGRDRHNSHSCHGRVHGTPQAGTPV